MKPILVFVLFASAVGCDDSGSTSAPQSVPPSNDLSAVAPTGGDMVAVKQDMATGTPVFPMSAAVTVGPNGTLSYAPASVDIAAGGTVTWTWAAGNTMPHTVTSGDATPAFASSPVQTSGTFSATFATAGTFVYFCTVHGRNVMNGTVVVH